jgi:hypothetical protein
VKGAVSGMNGTGFIQQAVKQGRGDGRNCVATKIRI